MRICFLAHGESSHTYKWIQSFAEKGHQIHLISFDGYRFGPIENVTVHTIPPSFPDNIKILSYVVNGWLGPFINAFKIRRLVRRINPDILHAHNLSNYGSTGYLLHFPIFVVTAWGSDILVEPKKYLYSRIMVKLILNSAKLITGDSNTVRDECLKYCNQPEKTKVILWGVDLSTFHEMEDHSREKREKTKITIVSTEELPPRIQY